MQSGFLHGQKSIEKLRQDTSLTQIYVEAQLFNKLQISSKQRKSLSVQARLEGEYSAHQLLSFIRKGNTLFIRPNLSDPFELPNDKLSAHKVYAIDVSVVVPEHIEIVIAAKAIQLHATGFFKNLQISLEEGFCSLENLGGEIVVRTSEDPIVLKQSSGVVVAESSYGKLSLAAIPKGPARIHLSSVSGDISLLNQVP